MAALAEGAAEDKIAQSAYMTSTFSDVFLVVTVVIDAVSNVIVALDSERKLGNMLSWQYDRK